MGSEGSHSGAGGADEATRAGIPRRDAEATRRRIREAAESEFVEKGFDAARMDAIARAARANKRMIYVYFGGKETLYEEILRATVERALEVVRADDLAGLPPLEQTAEAIRRYFHFLRDNPGFVRLIVWDGVRREGCLGRSLGVAGEAALREIVGIVRRGIEAGEVREDIDPVRFVTTVSGICVSYFSLKVLRSLVEDDAGEEPGPDASDAYLEHVLHLVLDGIRSSRDA